jgi:hypothetical protein
MKEEDLLNLIIIERNKRELVFSNVIDNLKIEFVEDAFNKSAY